MEIGVIFSPTMLVTSHLRVTSLQMRLFVIITDDECQASATGIELHFENFAVLQHAAHPVDNIRLLGLLGTKIFGRCILGCHEMCRPLVFTDFVTVPQRDGKKKHKKRGAGKKRELLFVGTASGSLKAYDTVLGELRWNVTNCCEGCVLVLFITFQTAIQCLLTIKNGFKLLGCHCRCFLL